MSSKFYAFGELLWDCLPSGRHAGGAPFNVAAHLAQLGAPAAIVTAVGHDPLGDEILELARAKNIDTRFVARARAGLPTGTVQVAVDARGNATYEIVEPVAWDEIVVPPDAVAEIAQATALVYGSLAARSTYNLEQLERVLAVEGPVKFFDVNLRPPFADPKLVLRLAQHAHILKLNDDEAARLAYWVETGESLARFRHDAGTLAHACAVLSEATNTPGLCVTRGAEGALFWQSGRVFTAPAPHVTVRDTIGAGDAFTAGLMLGLTAGAPIDYVLENACRLGAFVASQDGAIPALPQELIENMRLLE